MTSTNLQLLEQIKQAIAEYPDFPTPGVIFREISPILLNPNLYAAIVDDLAAFSRGKIDVVCGIGSRGYFFGIALAQKLNVPFIPIRKAGKLPPPTVKTSYALEYGTAAIEMKPNLIAPNARVLIHDDLLATGGTTAAAANLLHQQNLKVAQFSFLVNLTYLNGIQKIQNIDNAEIYSLIDY